MQDRIASLDTLRGVAILMVVAGHYLPGTLVFGDAVWHLTSLGRGGVILFFVLSGYLIFWNVERQPPVTFLSRRIFKIFPAYWMSVAAVFAIGLLMEPKWPLDVLSANLVMSQDIFGKDLMSGVYWTLLIEVKFYVFIVVQYAIFRDRWTIVIPLAFVAVNVVILLLRGHASMLLTFLPAFYVGIQIRRCQRTERISFPPLAMIGIVAASLILFDRYYGWWSCMYTLAAAAGLMLAVRRDISNSVLNFFGRISYSYYLYHAAIGTVVVAWLGGRPVMAAAVAFSVSTLIAYVSFKFIELPFVKFGKTHERFWTSPREQRA